VIREWRRQLGAVSVVLGQAGACEASQEVGTPTAEVASTLLPYYNDADFTPRWSPDLDGFHRVRDFELVDQRGGKLTREELRGRVTVVDFFFTSCPAICPKLTASMASLQREFLLDDDVMLLSHSVTPDIDTPAVLQAYGAKHGVDFTRWRLVTGSQQEIYDLGRNYYFVEEIGLNKSAGEFLHTENFVLVDGDFYLRGIYNGLDPRSMKQLAEDVRLLQNEARKRR
jgi:protein SCO1